MSITRGQWYWTYVISKGSKMIRWQWSCDTHTIKAMGFSGLSCRAWPDFFLFSLTFICLSLLPLLTALSPARLISVNYQWPTWLFYFGCEKGRAVDEIRFFLPHGSIFHNKEGSRTVTCVRSVVPGRAVGEWEGCNGMRSHVSYSGESWRKEGFLLCLVSQLLSWNKVLENFCCSVPATEISWDLK